MRIRAVVYVVIIWNIYMLQLHNSSEKDEVDPFEIMPYFPHDIKQKYYSGYLQIADTERAIHYIYVPSQNQVQQDPLIIWMNGGPGCSSFLGLFYEIGPYIYTDDDYETQTLKKNKFSWNTNASLLFFESHAEVGFSRGTTNDTYKYTDESMAEDNYKALISFYEKFPDFWKRDLYISGESYAGIYIPFFASEIVKHNKEIENIVTHYGTKMRKINLVGFISINPVTNILPKMRKSDSNFYYYKALSSPELYNEITKACRRDKTSKDCLSKLSNTEQEAGNINMYNIYRDCQEGSVRCVNDRQMTKMLRETRIRQALHIPDDIKEFQTCGDNLHYSEPTDSDGSYHLYPQLINHKLKILILAGNSDAAVPITTTMEWIDDLKKQKIIQNTRQYRPFKVQQQIVGYIDNYDNFIFINVLGTGHMIPQWKPQPAYHILLYYLFNIPLEY